MLTVTEAQLATMTREHILDRIHRFLIARSSDTEMQALLASRGMCREFWLPWYEEFAGLDEHGLAVRLSYLLAARAHGFDPQFVHGTGSDVEIAMKCQLEERGILPFIAFDEG